MEEQSPSPQSCRQSSELNLQGTPLCRTSGTAPCCTSGLELHSLEIANYWLWQPLHIRQFRGAVPALMREQPLCHQEFHGDR